MSWTPEEEEIDTVVMVENLINFLTANQDDAFKWVNGSAGLKPFKSVYNNASGRVVENFPSLMLRRDRLESNDSDSTEATWTIELEVAIEGDQPDELTVEGRKYRDALSLLLKNAGRAIAQNARKPVLIYRAACDVEFDVISPNVRKGWNQVFRITAQYSLN